MHNPHFYVAAVNRSRIIKPPSAYETQRINVYELEFYTEDHPGGTVTDGEFRPTVKGGFCIFKPGQYQKLVPPYHCYMMNIVVLDPELKSQLDKLPTFSMLWNMDEAVQLLQKMLPLKAEDTLQNRMRIHSYALELLALLFENNQTAEQTDLNILRHQEVLLAADQYIRTHLSEDLSLNTLAKQANLDPTYFHKLFTAAFGITLAKQILNHRIAAVKAGLLDERISLRTLALRCGFSSPSYMGVKFRQMTGMTLTEYRQKTMQIK